jgi:acylphosphatase
LLVPKRVHVVIAGRVQGVGFRWYCRDEAVRRRLAGYVKNRSDGRVEAVFEGEQSAVDGMVEWCRTGPDWAKVEAVESWEERPTGEGSFLIAR